MTKRRVLNLAAAMSLLVLTAVGVMRANSRSVVGPAAEGYPKYYAFGQEAGPLMRAFVFGPPAVLLFDLSLVVLVAWLVATLVRLRVKRNREASNLCLSCGYDLRASPERCPECGALPKVNA